ncbi:MAG: hypothetical protein QM770_16285 [Tepidisphaeraceae bacterium]
MTQNASDKFQRPIATTAAITLFRRWLLLGTAIKIALWCAFAVAVIVGTAWIVPLGYSILIGIVLLWVLLLVPSYRTAQLALSSGPLIAAGDLSRAEDQLGRSIRGFSVIRAGKVAGLQQLAMLRHAQKRWAEAVQLTRELLSRQSESDQQLQKTSRLVLIDSLLELGDVHAAGLELARVEQYRPDLKELMSITTLRLDFLARIGDWPAMFAQVSRATALAEIMPARMAARVQALLALAARRVGRDDWAKFLTTRVELLTDIDELVKHRPILWELWSAKE